MLKSPKVERKLAAIVFTDIVGFTEITAYDQSQALDILKQQRKILKPLVELYNGKWVKEIGDGLLLIFDTVTDAVNCSIDIQNKTKSIDNIYLRIGIHQGEIVLQENDVIGDDVNIASRIEAFSATGGIAISNKVNDAIIREKEFKTECIGKPKLKGVSQEVKVYCITSHGLPKTDLSKVSAKLEKEKSKYNIFTLTGGVFTAIGILFWLYVSIFDISLAEESEVPAIAILPLDNKGEAEDEFYAYGISSDLISDVASAGLIRVSSLSDIEKLDYKNIDNIELSKKLNIRYIASGTIWKLDNIFQLSLELYDTKFDKVVWLKRWEEKWSELSQVKNLLSENILKNLKFNFKYRKSIFNPEAYEYYLKGKYLYENMSSNNDKQKSIEFLDKAINSDSTLIIAKLELANYLTKDRLDFDKSKYLISSSLKYSTITDNKLFIANSIKLMGNYFFYKDINLIDSANYYWKKALKKYVILNDYNGIQDCFNSLALIAARNHNIFLADSLYNEALKIGYKIQSNRYNATTYYNKSKLYSRNSIKENILKSNQYLGKSIKLSKKSNFDIQLMDSHFLLAQNYENLYQYENAVEEFKKSNQIAKRFNYIDYQIKNSLYISNLKIKIGKLEEVPKYLNIINMLQNEFITHEFLFKFYEAKYNFSMKNYLDAIENLDSILNPKILSKYVANKYNLNKEGYQYLLEKYKKEINILRYLSLKNINKPNKNSISIDHFNEKMNFELNYFTYLLFDDNSYIKYAFIQIQEIVDAMDDDLGEKFLNYPIPKQIIEEYNKVF